MKQIAGVVTALVIVVLFLFFIGSTKPSQRRELASVSGEVGNEFYKLFLTCEQKRERGIDAPACPRGK